jgi:hypothetical protein
VLTLGVLRKYNAERAAVLDFSWRSFAFRLTQNPKTGPKEARVILGTTVLERRRDNAEESSHEKQIVAVLRQGKTGEKLADICREVGISEGTYYAWKKQPS